MNQHRCYSLFNLQRFKNKPFIREYKSGIKFDTTYSQIIDEIIKCLDNFKRYGIKEQVGIAIDVRDHSVESSILLLGILNHGCYFYCAEFATTKDIERHITASCVEYVISRDINKVERICTKIHGIIHVLSQQYYIGKMCTSKSSPMLDLNICYTTATSGSTGLPVMVHVPYDCIEPNIKSLCSTLRIDANDVIFLRSPPTFDPFVVEFFMALEKGATLLITTNPMRITPDSKLLEEITILQTTPSLFRLFGIQLIRDVIFAPKSSLRCLLLGGEQFPSHQEIQSWLPKDFSYESKRIFNVYGITEVSCWATIQEYQPFDKHVGSKVALGKPLDDLTFLRIKHETDGNLLPLTGSCKGELLIGSSVRRCFIPEYDKDVNKWKSEDVIYRNTGDVVESDEFGNVFYLGRVNNCIKRLGKRVCLDALANNIEYFLKYKSVCLWQDDYKRLIICFILNQNESYNKIKVQRLLKEHLHDYEQPDLLCSIHDPPLNKHGKICREKLLKIILKDRQLLNKSPLRIFQNFLADVMGLNDLTFSRLEDVTDEIESKRQKITCDISFSAAGGTSFQALSLATEIGEHLERPEEQRQLTEMLISSESSLQQIMDFLSTCKPATQKEYSHPLMDLSQKTTNNTSSIHLLWRTDLKKCVDAPPSLFRERCVAVGSHSRLLLTLDCITGEEISRTELSDRIECPVVFVSADLAIVGCYDGLLYGINFNSGSIQWTLNVNGMIKAKPMVLDNLVIVASYAEDFNMRAFDLKTLKCLWYLKLGSKGILSSPLKVTDKLVLICTLDGSYALIETESSNVKWLKQLESPIFSTPAQLNSFDKEIVLAEVKGRVAVCNKDNGEVITFFSAAGNIFSNITLHQKTSHTSLIIFGCHDGNVYCLEYKSSTIRLSLQWKITLNSAVYSTPTMAFDDTIVACSTKGLIVLIDITGAKIKTFYDVKAEIFSTPCIKEEKYIYVGSRDNFLYAFIVQ